MQETAEKFVKQNQVLIKRSLINGQVKRWSKINCQTSTVKHMSIIKRKTKSKVRKLKIKTVNLPNRKVERSSKA